MSAYREPAPRPAPRSLGTLTFHDGAEIDVLVESDTGRCILRITLPAKPKDGQTMTVNLAMNSKSAAWVASRFSLAAFDGIDDDAIEVVP